MTDYGRKNGLDPIRILKAALLFALTNLWFAQSALKAAATNRFEHYIQQNQLVFGLLSIKRLSNYRFR